MNNRFQCLTSHKNDDMLRCSKEINVYYLTVFIGILCTRCSNEIAFVLLCAFHYCGAKVFHLFSKNSLIFCSTIDKIDSITLLMMMIKPKTKMEQSYHGCGTNETRRA